jgi:hypothetical protein
MWPLVSLNKNVMLAQQSLPQASKKAATGDRPPHPPPPQQCHVIFTRPNHVRPVPVPAPPPHAQKIGQITV